MPPKSQKSPIGAHVSVAGGLAKTGLRLADEIGAETIQIFVGNPRGWANPKPDPEGDENFRVLAAERGLPVFVHAPYLINFGSPDEATREKSASALHFSLTRGAAVGARGVVLHAGSAVQGERFDEALEYVKSSLLPVLDDALEDGSSTQLLIEPTAGGGGALASDLESLERYLGVLGNDERIGVCLDICHLHAAGHDLSTRTKLAGVLRSAASISSASGRGGVGLIHVNNSRDTQGSKRDRHAALGSGTLDLDVFGALFSTKALKGVAMVVETPDADQVKDIAALKELRG